MQKVPYMQFYAGDYLNDDNIKKLSLAAQGLYIRILCCFWLESGRFLPMDGKLLSRILGIPVEEFTPLWEELLQSECNLFTLSHDGSMFTYGGLRNGTL